MNKRQQKKMVKKAIQHYSINTHTKADLHILKRFGDKYQPNWRLIIAYYSIRDEFINEVGKLLSSLVTAVPVIVRKASEYLNQYLNQRREQEIVQENKTDE